MRSWRCQHPPLSPAFNRQLLSPQDNIGMAALITLGKVTDSIERYEDVSHVASPNASC